MLTQLTTDLCRILKHNLLRFDNDASACYDRIIVALGMLAAQRCGMPTNAIKIHSDVLRSMQYTVKTSHGVSEGNYKSTALEPLFGTGQGSGASPSVWLTLSMVMLNTLEKLVPERITFESFTGSRSHSRMVDAFVDDTSLGLTSPSGTSSLDELITRLQTIAQTWEHILYLSGGKLNLSKCSWYAMFWEWKNGRPSLQHEKPEDRQITLQQGSTPSRTIIRRTKPQDSVRMLGVHLNPMGDFTDHLQVLQKKADNYAMKLASPKLTATDIRIFHRSIYIPSMRYSLPTIAVNEEDLQSVQSRVIQVMLQRLHVSSTIPTSIRHGPIELGGLGLYDLRTEVGVEAIKFFRNAIYSDSENGNLLRINLQYSQLEAGIGNPLLEFPNQYIPYLTPTWVLSLRQYMSRHNITIKLTEDYTPQLTVKHDQYIMQQQHLSRYTESQQRDINYVRMHLQVIRISDMVNREKPNTLQLEYIDASRPDTWTDDSRWPRQEFLTASQRRLWKRYIQSSFLRYLPYLKDPPDLNAPSALHPPIDTNRALATEYPNLKEYVRSLPKFQRRMLTDLEQVSDDITVWRAFRSKARLYVASDGGLQGTSGTFGWVLASKKQVLFKCAGPVDGPYDTSSSTRSELCGCASALLLVVSLSRFWGLRHRSTFRWYTDSRSAITRITKHSRWNSRRIKLPNDHDLLSIISELKHELGRPFRSEWVKGHQDSLRSYEQLPRSARLNIDADFLATRYRLRGRLHSSPRVDHIPEQQVSITLNGTRLTSQYDECIRYHINGYHLRKYIQEKQGWTDQVWESVDFRLFGKHFRRLQPHKQVTHMKMVHGQLPLGERRLQQSLVKDTKLGLCPCCMQSQETSTHLLTCRSNREMLRSLEQLQISVCQSQAHPARHLLVQGIQHWSLQHNKPFSPDISHYPNHLHQTIRMALDSQSSIGWEQATKGFLTKQWMELSTMSMKVDHKADVDKGEQTMKCCISEIYNHMMRIWNSRNETLHNSGDTSLKEVRSQEIAEVKHYHNNRHLLCVKDRHYCERSLEKLINGPASTRRRWLRRVKQSCKEYRRESAKQTCIPSFFRKKE